MKHQAAKVWKVWKANRAFRLSDAGFENFEKVYLQFGDMIKRIAELDRQLPVVAVGRPVPSAAVDVIRAADDEGHPDPLT